MTNDQKEEVAYWLKELESVGIDFTKWELGFLESVTEQFANKQHLSDRQYEILKRIYEKKTA